MRRKKLYIETIGCPKNYVDSEFLAGAFVSKGYDIVHSPDDADTILVNTCGFIRPAKEESIDYILQYSRLNKEVIVMGCLVNRYKKELQDEIKEINNFYTIDEAFNKFAGVKYNKNINYSKRYFLDNKNYKYVKISEGCNHRCSFCTIPFIKGSLFSRKSDDIIKEIENITSQGVNEIILTSQDLINFGTDNNETLYDLLKKIDNINGDFKVRLLYMFPDERLIDIVKFIASSEKFINYLDIPIQHINEEILKKMNRPSSYDFYKSLIESIRNIIPDIVLRSTFIIGFPGESEKEFNELKDFLKDVKLNWVGFYKYSDEEGTKASELNNKVADEVAEKRLEEIVELQKEITDMWLKSRLGKIYDFYVDEVFEEEGVIIGRSEFETPDIDGNIIVKNISDFTNINNRKVKIVETLDYDMEGVFV